MVVIEVVWSFAAMLTVYGTVAVALLLCAAGLSYTLWGTRRLFIFVGALAPSETDGKAAWLGTRCLTLGLCGLCVVAVFWGGSFALFLCFK